MGHDSAIQRDIADRAAKKAAERRRQRKHLLARMAGNIAAGMVDGFTASSSNHYGTIKSVAIAAVSTARTIMAELDAELPDEE